MNNNYGVTPQGFRIKRLVDIKNELENYFIGEFGEINLDPQSVTGQIIGIYSKVLADIWENLEDVYLSQYPNSASGVSLDNVVQLNGITRLPASRTTVVGVATGSEGTLIQSGKLASVQQTNDIFEVVSDSFITRSNAVSTTLSVNSASAQIYNVVISGINYTYSLPTLNFSGPFVSGNSISIRLNGINLPVVNYTTSSANTFSLLSASLLTSPAVSSAVVVGNSIEITPTLGFQVTVNSVNVTGAGAPSYTQSLRSPASVNLIAQYLSAVIDSSALVTATSLDSTINISAESVFNPYSIIVGSLITIISNSSPVNFISQELGAIAVPANSLTQILTPVAGWTSITNWAAGATGREVETDSELRLRRETSIRLLGSGTVEAIRARILQEVPGVTSVSVFENVTLTQSPLEVVFSTVFGSDNSIAVNLDGGLIGTVPFTISQSVTIGLIASLIQSQQEIKLVTIVSGDLELEVEMEETQVVELSFSISGTSVPTYIISGGRPPKSFESVVEGGADDAIALKIWQLKPAGIQTFGNQTIIVNDSQGNPQAISFSRASPVYIFALVSLTLNPQETFPSNGLQLVSDAILTYGNNLGIGVDVFIQRVQAAIFTVPGIASSTVQLARTLNPNDSPVYSASDISITTTEISNWSLSRINVGF